MVRSTSLAGVTTGVIRQEVRMREIAGTDCSTYAMQIGMWPLCSFDYSWAPIRKTLIGQETQHAWSKEDILPSLQSWSGVYAKKKWAFSSNGIFDIQSRYNRSQSNENTWTASVCITRYVATLYLEEDPAVLQLARKVILSSRTQKLLLWYGWSLCWDLQVLVLITTSKKRVQPFGGLRMKATVLFWCFQEHSWEWREAQQ